MRLQETKETIDTNIRTFDLSDAGQETIWGRNQCRHCKKTNHIKLNKEQFLAWTTGGLLIQNAFPQLTPEERDLILMGFHPECWDIVFKRLEDGKEQA